MSFRKYGGMNYAATHNIVKSNVNTSDSLYVTNNVGQKNSYINFDSDISGNILVYGDFDLSGNLNVAGNIDCSKNLIVVGKSYFYEDVDISGNLTVLGDINHLGNLTVGGKSHFNDDVDVSGNLKVSKDVIYAGDLTVEGKSYFNDDIVVKGNSTVTGSSTSLSIYLSETKDASDYAANEVVTKSYVDTASQGLSVKAPCNCIAHYDVKITDSSGVDVSFNVLSTYKNGLIIDAHDLSANFSYKLPYTRVLVNNQGTPDTSAADSNGIYDVSRNSTGMYFVRSGDMPVGSDALGAFTYIHYGLTYSRSSWVQSQKLDNAGTPLVVGGKTSVGDSTSLLFAEYQSFAYKLGRGLDLHFNSNTTFTYLIVDACLNFINNLDNNTTDITNPGVNIGTINLGANTTNINIGSSNQLNQINIT